MIVATRFWRNSIICVSFLLAQTTMIHAMIWDNRYIPWIDQLYTGGDSRDRNIQAQGFFLSGGEAYRFEQRADKNEQIVTYPELWGQLDIAQVNQSIMKAGLGNCLPDDWLWLANIDAYMPASLNGQGFMLSGYVPLAPHFGVGGSVAMLKLNTCASVIPGEQANKDLNLNTPGNQSLFQQSVQTIYNKIGITQTASQQVGVGDVVLYASLFDVHEYKYKFRKLDWGIWAGVIIPSGLKYESNNLASIPFGGNWGGWAWFLAPRAEFQLRDDLKFGVQARIIKRVDTCFDGRVPLGKEQVLFAPIQNKLFVDQGTSFGTTLYFVFEEIRAGLGAQIQYTITYHEHDSFKVSNMSNFEVNYPGLTPKMNNMNYYSGWTQEYFMIKLFYDIGHDKLWDWRPMAYFSWDVPMNHLFGRGFAKTNKVAIGCSINF